MNRILRYQISDWSQITECLSNNSRDLFLSLSKYTSGDSLIGFGIKVNHNILGTLFAAMIDGHGTLVTEQDDEGADIPFLTKDEILKQLMKFGFYITYDVKNNLPEFVLDFLYKVMNLGYDKISRIALESYDVNGNRVWRPTVIVMKSGYNTDLLTFDCKVFRKKFDEKLESNTLMNVTHEPGMIWDWLAYIANIEDILDENHYPPEPEPQPDPEPEPEPDPEEGEDNGL